jgi:hypothetical protein
MAPLRQLLRRMSKVAVAAARCIYKNSLKSENQNRCLRNIWMNGKQMLLHPSADICFLSSGHCVPSYPHTRTRTKVASLKFARKK